MNQNETLLNIRGLKTYFSLPGNLTLRAVDGVDLEVRKNEVVGLVGESGCGKTVFSLSILRLINSNGKIEEGEIFWQGKNLLQLNEEALRKIRGKEIAMIFQNAEASLNPVYSIGSQMISVIRLHHKVSRKEAEDRALELLRLVGIADGERRIKDYPHQFSGGMCQRIMIAMALSCQPKLLIADEPTASLDVTIQAQIMDLLLEIKNRFGMAILLISHDLGVVAQMCDKIAIMYLGRIVELSSAEDIFSSPLHPYTQALIKSVPLPDPQKRDKVKILKGELPSPVNLPVGCAFRSRCPKAFDRCSGRAPELRNRDHASHFVACFLWD